MIPIPQSGGQWVAMMFGASLAAVGSFHFIRHALVSGASLGPHDWAAVAIIVIGAGIAFNQSIVNLIRAWRTKDT